MYCFSGAVCNNAEIVGDQLLGQPTEGAILAAAIKVSMIFLNRHDYGYWVSGLVIFVTDRYLYMNFLHFSMVCTMPEISTKDWKKCLSVLKLRKCQSKSGIKK